MLNAFPGRRRSFVAAKTEKNPVSEPGFSLPKKLWQCPKCKRNLKQGIARHMRNCEG